jgi:hypothetical protein
MATCGRAAWTGAGETDAGSGLYPFTFGAAAIGDA